MTESNHPSSSSQAPQYAELPQLFHSIADSLLYKTRHLAQLKASQIEELNKLAQLEQATKKRQAEVQRKAIKYEEYGEKLRSNQLTKHDIKAIVNIYMSILSLQDDELEAKKKKLREKEKEVRIQENILSLISKQKDNEVSEEKVSDRSAQTHKKMLSYDKDSSESIAGKEERVSESSKAKARPPIKRQRSVPLPKKSSSKGRYQIDLKEHRESNSSSIHQIEDSLLDKLEQNIPAMQCIQNDQLITDSIQMQNDSIVNEDPTPKRRVAPAKGTNSAKKVTKETKNSISIKLSKGKESDKVLGNEAQAESFHSISAQSFSNHSNKKRVPSSKPLNLSKQDVLPKQKLQNKNKSTQQMKAKMNIVPLSFNAPKKTKETEGKSSRNKTEHSEKSSSHNSSLKEMGKALKRQSMKFIQIMNKLVAHAVKRKKAKAMTAIIRFSLRINKKKSVLQASSCALSRQIKGLGIRIVLDSLVKQVLPLFIESSQMKEGIRKETKDSKGESLKLQVKQESSDMTYGRLNTNEQLKSDIKIVSVDDLSEDNDYESEHCDFKTYQQSLKKIKELTQETQCLENNMKLFANQINTKSLPTA